MELLAGQDPASVPFPHIQVEAAADRELPAGFHFEAHLHRSVDLLLCTTGQLTVTVQDIPVELSAGEYLVVCPDVLRSVSADVAVSSRILQLRFFCSVCSVSAALESCSQEDSFLLELALEKRKYLKGRSSAQLEACLTGALAEFRGQDTGFESMLAAYVRQLVILLSRDLNASNDLPLRRSHYLILAARYIGRHCTEKISVSAVAKAAGISSRYLTRLFQEQLGLGVSNYITDLRISRSIDFMSAQPGYPLSRLALDMGFSSQQHFSRVFKSRMGVPPGKYFARLPECEV